MSTHLQFRCHALDSGITNVRPIQERKQEENEERRQDPHIDLAKQFSLNHGIDSEVNMLMMFNRGFLDSVHVDVMFAMRSCR